MKIDRANKFMVSRAVVFCEIVSQISFPQGPIDLESTLLGNAVSEPVEAHVNDFESVLLDGVVEDTIGGAVVGSDRGRELFVSEFNESDSVWDCCTGIEVAYTDFGFSSGGEDILHDGCDGVEGGFEEFTIFLSEEEEAFCLASGSAGNKVGGITVNVEDHVAGAIEFDLVKVTSAIVKEIRNVSNCFLGVIQFGGGEFIDCMEHGVVQRAGNV